VTTFPPGARARTWHRAAGAAWLGADCLVARRAPGIQVRPGPASRAGPAGTTLRGEFFANLIEPWGDVVTSEDELVSGPDSESGEGLFWQKPRPIGVMWRG